MTVIELETLASHTALNSSLFIRKGKGRCPIPIGII